MTAPAATRWIYDFAEGSREMRDLLGGKGANVAEMTRVLGPELVPGGLHDHDGGVRRLHARRPHRAGRASRRRSTRRSSGSRTTPAGGSATRRTRCSSPFAAARATRCPG